MWLIGSVPSTKRKKRKKKEDRVEAVLNTRRATEARQGPMCMPAGCRGTCYPCPLGGRAGVVLSFLGTTGCRDRLGVKPGRGQRKRHTAREQHGASTGASRMQQRDISKADVTRLRKERSTGTQTLIYLE